LFFIIDGYFIASEDIPDLTEKSFLTTGEILKGALNAAYSEDKEINYSNLVLLPVFEGKRYLYGGDFRLELLDFLISG
jgi:hypothetical protein